MHYRKQPWGVFHYVVLSVLREVMVGHIARGRLHVTEYVFPDIMVSSGILIDIRITFDKRNDDALRHLHAVQ